MTEVLQLLRRAVLFGPAVVALVLVAGCSGADPAEVDAAASPYTASDGPLGVPLAEDQARCRIEVFLESDLSAEAIAAIKRGEPPAPKTEDDIEVFADLADELAAKCLEPGE